VVIPSELEMGALTTAEAESIRFYSDASLSTELPREVVSADEIHVKVSSVSSSTEIWADYDGIRSDYAVTDTYGRNAVWSDYRAVWHLGNTTDSTGNGFTLTESGSVSVGAEKIGNGYDLPGGSSDWLVIPDGTFNSPSEYTFTIWYKPDALSGIDTALLTFQNDYNTQLFHRGDSSRLEHSTYDGSTEVSVYSDSISIGTWVKATAALNSGTMYTYTDGALSNSASSNNPSTVSAGSRIGSHRTGFGNEINGKVDECRLTNNYLGLSWETTEHANQNDNAAFWVATEVETVTASPIAHILQMI